VKRTRSPLCFVLLVSFGCSGSSSEAFDQAALVESLGTVVIIPTYRAFADEAAALVTEAESFCAAPGTASLESLQAQWRATRGRWKQNDVVAFGPFREQPWRLGPKIDFFPVREDTIAENLAIDEPFTLERVSALGTASRGLGTIEYLIFDTEGLETVLARFEGDNRARRCEYVVALAQDLQVNANDMVDAWSPSGDDYLGNLVSSGEPGTQFASIREATNEIVNRMLFVVDDIRVRRLGRPLGLDSGGQTRPDQLESRYSDHSIEDILATLNGLENLYRGEFTGSTGMGIQDWVEARNRALASAVLDEIGRTRAAVQEIPEPLRLAIEENPGAVRNAVDVGLDLRNIIGVDVVNALGSTVSFNDSDGD